MNVIDTHCHVISPDEARFPRAPIGGKQSGWATTRAGAAGHARGHGPGGDPAGCPGAGHHGLRYDNAYVLDCCQRWPERFIAVGTVDPLQPGAGARLPGTCGDGGLSGVRLFTSGSTVPTQGEWFAVPETYDFWEAAAETGITVCLQMRLGPATKQLISVLERFPRSVCSTPHGLSRRRGLPVAGRKGNSGARAVSRPVPEAHPPDPGTPACRRKRGGRFPCPRARRIRRGPHRLGFQLPGGRAVAARLVELAKRVLDVAPPEAREVIFAQTARRLYPALGKATS